MKLYKGDCLEKFECANCGCYFMVEDRSNFECPNCEEDSFRLIEDYAINMIDNLPIGEAIKVVSYYDSRPLTDETLEELGFERKGMKGMEYWQKKFADGYYLVAKRNPDYAVPYVCGIEFVDTPVCKTVGKIKMLIEALKGDE